VGAFAPLAPPGYAHVSELAPVKSDAKYTVIYGDLIKESALSRSLFIPSEDERVINYFFQSKPHYKTFEIMKSKLRRLV